MVGRRAVEAFTIGAGLACALVVGLVIAGGCAPEDRYSGPARVVLEMSGQVLNGRSEALSYRRAGEDFELAAIWSDADAGAIAVRLSRAGGAVGSDLVMRGSTCRVTRGGLVLEGNKQPYPITWSGACQRDARDVEFRFAFVPERQ